MAKMFRSIRFLFALACALSLLASCGQSSSSSASQPSPVTRPVPAEGVPDAAPDSAPAPAAAALPAAAAAPQATPAAVPELPTSSVSVAALLAAAGTVDFAVLSAQAADAERAGLAEALIADLEARAAAPDAPPEVHVALSALYGRKGLKTKEYAALAAAETAAAKPGISFNVALVHGRKSLLAGAPDADSFMVGGLELASDPPGAAVWIDGAPAGSCPVRVEKVRAGTRKLRFVKQGYADAETAAEVGVGSSVSVAAALRPKPARVTISCDAPLAKVAVDKEDRGRAGTALEVAPGLHEFVLSEPNRKPIVFELALEPGAEISKSFKMETASHKWMIITSPAKATVTVNGKIVGVSPIGELEVPAGIYDFKYELANHITIVKKEKLMLGEDGFKFPYISELLTFRIPTAAIKVDGKKEDWAGVPIVPDIVSAFDAAPDASGSQVHSVRICQDGRYVYWMLELADGKPAKRTGIAYGVEFHYDPKAPSKKLAMRLANNSNATGYKPELSHGPLDGNTSRDVWSGNGSSSDYDVGPDFIEARFPKALMLSVLKTGVPYRLVVGSYLEGKKSVDSRWSGAENKAVQFD
jgi:hypothetical protein